MRIRSFLTISISQELREARVAEGRGRQVVAEQCGVNLRRRDELFVDLTALHQQQARQQGQQRQRRHQLGPQALAVGSARTATERQRCAHLHHAGAGRARRRAGRTCLGSAGQGLLARKPQPFGHIMRQISAALGQAGGDAQPKALGTGVHTRIELGRAGRKMWRLHSVIPFAFRDFASACTAREQCVLTLPSEQPITEAVSATSNSSQ
mmetsp:Transcript_75033/g.176107  ORF Transcript_75033/g.176107 Transcript_75033/m.176107 type:complete len:209 (+) Transcript_75033:3420-4046(+)